MALKKREIFEILLMEFKSEVFSIVEEIEFQPSVFSTDHFGQHGREHFYTFFSLHNPQILEMVHFTLFMDELRILPRYNRFSLSKPVLSLQELAGRDGNFRVQPFVRTEKEIGRWAQVPFLKIPLSYKVKPVRSDTVTKKRIDRTIQNLAGDIEYIEITRAEWVDEFTPFEVDPSKI
ncbi:MAG: hypothetical protein AAGD04_16710 [Pseudomonadota bacterium]